MAVFFLVFLVLLVAAVWAVVAYVRAGAKAADTGIDRTTSADDAPSLLEDDLSFADPEDQPAGDESERAASVPRAARR